jgi:hypothetical protein
LSRSAGTWTEGSRSRARPGKCMLAVAWGRSCSCDQRAAGNPRRPRCAQTRELQRSAPVESVTTAMWRTLLCRMNRPCSTDLHAIEPYTDCWQDMMCVQLDVYHVYQVAVWTSLAHPLQSLRLPSRWPANSSARMTGHQDTTMATTQQEAPCHGIDKENRLGDQLQQIQLQYMVALKLKRKFTTLLSATGTPRCLAPSNTSCSAACTLVTPTCRAAWATAACNTSYSACRFHVEHLHTVPLTRGLINSTATDRTATSSWQPCSAAHGSTAAPLSSVAPHEAASGAPRSRAGQCHRQTSQRRPCLL